MNEIIDIGFGVLAGLAVSGLIVLTFLVWKISEVLKARKKVGGEAIIGEVGEVLSFENGKGYALIRGEVWKIVSRDSLKRGDKVVVLDRRGLTLLVRKEAKDIWN